MKPSYIPTLCFLYHLALFQSLCTCLSFCLYLSIFVYMTKNSVTMISSAMNLTVIIKMHLLDMQNSFRSKFYINYKIMHPFCYILIRTKLWFNQLILIFKLYTCLATSRICFSKYFNKSVSCFRSRIMNLHVTHFQLLSVKQFAQDGNL